MQSDQQRNVNIMCAAFAIMDSDGEKTVCTSCGSSINVKNAVRGEDFTFFCNDTCSRGQRPTTPSEITNSIAQNMKNQLAEEAAQAEKAAQIARNKQASVVNSSSPPATVRCFNCSRTVAKSTALTIDEGKSYCSSECCLTHAAKLIDSIDGHGKYPSGKR